MLSNHCAGSGRGDVAARERPVTPEQTCLIAKILLWMLTGSDQTLGEGAYGHLHSAFGLTSTVLMFELDHWDRSAEV